MNPTPEHNYCPICNKTLNYSSRYPNYVCPDCASEACDKNGDLLSFSNISFSGGYQAHYSTTGEEYDSHTCYIDGIECHADEARFGGIVIETKTESR